MKTVNTDEKNIQSWATRIVSDLNRWPTQGVPFGKVKLSRKEQYEQWQANRGDPNYWQKLLTEQTPQDVLQYDAKMQEWETTHAGTESDTD